MTHDVFLSYSKSDKTVADAACATLERHGIRVWIAPRDVTPGSDWGEAIVDAITTSRAVVLVLSASSNDSPQVRREVQRAFEHNITVIPLRVENVVPARALEYYIGPVHWLDALTPPLEAHLDRLADSVRRLVATTPEVPPFEHRRPLPQMPPVESSEPPRGAPEDAGAARTSTLNVARPAIPAWAPAWLAPWLTARNAAIAGAVLLAAVFGLAALKGGRSEVPTAASPSSAPVRTAAAPDPYHGILDGDWSVAFTRADGVRYAGQLTMTGDSGTMTLTEYPRRGRPRKIAQTMKLMALDQGFAVRGSSPVDPASGSALPSYAADTLVFTPAGDKSFRVATCDERAFGTRDFTDCPLVTLRDAARRS